MYIECKALSLNGEAKIGRMTFSKSGQSLTYRGRTFQRKQGYKINHYEIETGDEFWISGLRKDGRDRLYPESGAPVEVDEDVAQEYWTVIRGQDARA